MTLALLALLATQQVREDVKDWKLVTSEHFDLHYPADDLLSRAREFLGLFEEARGAIAETCGATLTRRINVFLFRSFHDLNQASLLGQWHPARDLRKPLLDGAKPHRFCGLERAANASLHRAFAFAEPLRDRIFIHCQASDRWNRWFVRHELVHQLQFQEIFPWRLPSFLIPLKNPLIPQWFWEGFADYGAGIFDSSKDEWLRSGRIFSLKEYWDGDALDDHDYLAVYYQGSMFFKFLEEEIGRGTAAKVFRTYADTFPLTMNRVLRSSTGSTQSELDERFQAWLKKRYETARVHPELQQLEHYRRRTWGGRRSPDGKHTAWISNDDVRPDLYVDGDRVLGHRRGLNVDGIHSPPSWSADSRRLVLAISWVNTDYLYIVDLEEGRECIRVPGFDELHDPCFTPDGTEVVFVGMRSGTTDLYAIRLADRVVRRLTDDADGEAGPAVGPDGSIAFIRETAGRTTLMLLKDGAARAVTKTNALLERPQWTADARTIVVAADVDGYWDAFAVDVATGGAKRLTKFAGGVHAPQPTGEGLLFTYFANRGTELHTIPWNPQDEPAWEQEKRDDGFAKPAPVGESAPRSRTFALEYLMAPLSSGSFAAPGLEFQIGDLEGENVLTLTAMGAGPRAWQASATVANTRWRPTFGAFAAGEAIGDLRAVSGGPFVEMPLGPTWRVAWIARDLHEFEDDFNDPHVFDSGPTASAFFSTQAGVQPRDPSWGFAVGATASFFREDFGGDRDLNEYFGVFEASRALAQDWILWLRASYDKRVGPLLESEVPQIESAVRGAEDLEGTDVGRVSLELRFPLWRDLFFMPLEPIGLGEYVLIKDLRAFVFGDAGFAGLEAGDLDERERGAVSAGIGLRVDLFAMAWPIVNVRAPVRLEFWYARVGMSGREPADEAGFGFVLGY